MSTPTCPRCGYDLSGHTASWESSCPVEGQCSECGLEFFWREILREDEQANPRHIEHCPRRAIPLAAIRTLVWCILPWVFWKRVELRHEPRVGRMVLWLVLLLVSLHVLASVMLAIAMWRVEARAVRDYNADLAASAKITRDDIAWLDAGIESSGSTRRQVERLLEHRTQLVQVLSSMPPPAVGRGLSVGRLATAIGYPFVLIDDGHVTLIRRMFGNAPIATGPRGPWSVELLPFWKKPAVLCGLGFSFTFAIMLAILPATRRKLRIRWVHLLRASVFGFAWLAVPSLLGMIEHGSYIIQDLSTPTGSPQGKVLLVGTLAMDWALWCWVFVGWSATWWVCAVWRGLRFPAPLFHWSLLVIPAALVALIGVFVSVNPLEIDTLFSPGDWVQRRGYYNWPLAERLISGGIQRLR